MADFKDMNTSHNNLRKSLSKERTYVYASYNCLFRNMKSKSIKQDEKM